MSDIYTKTLTLYYEEEIEGEAYFRTLADLTDDPHHKDCLTLLADVERHAAHSVRPLIERHGLTPRPSADLCASGAQDARSSWTNWADLLAEMAQTYPGYLDAFDALTAMGPAEDVALLDFLAEHERAALAFLALETKGDPQSTQPLRAYLAARPGVLA